MNKSFQSTNSTSSLEKTVVCFTGVSIDIRDLYEERINSMGGQVSRVLDNTVTHLIAKECNTSSEKYMAACEQNLPIMKLSWLEDAWKLFDNNDLRDMTTVEIIRKYLLPIFFNTVFTISGFSLEERHIIGNLIEINGGKVAIDMKRNECTHLIAKLNSGSKYEAAKKWGISIVDTYWLRKCIEQNVLPTFFQCSADYPFFVVQKGWCAFDVNKCVNLYGLDCQLLEMSLPEKCQSINENFNFNIIESEDDKTEVFEFMQTQFRTTEPISQAIGISATDTFSFYKDICTNCFLKPYSIIARNKADNKLAGISLNGYYEDFNTNLQTNEKTEETVQKIDYSEGS